MYSRKSECQSRGGSWKRFEHLAAVTVLTINTQHIEAVRARRLRCVFWRNNTQELTSQLKCSRKYTWIFYVKIYVNICLRENIREYLFKTNWKQRHKCTDQTCIGEEIARFFEVFKLRRIFYKFYCYVLNYKLIIKIF